jgi:hypothetical protein
MKKNLPIYLISGGYGFLCYTLFQAIGWKYMILFMLGFTLVVIGIIKIAKITRT